MTLIKAAGKGLSFEPLVAALPTSGVWVSPTEKGM